MIDSRQVNKSFLGKDDLEEWFTVSMPHGSLRMCKDPKSCKLHELCLMLNPSVQNNLISEHSTQQTLLGFTGCQTRPCPARGGRKIRRPGVCP